MSFFNELKRRNVFRVGAAYAVASWVVLQLFDVVGEILELPLWGGKLILVVIIVGFFLALILAWAFELTPQGIKRESEVDRSQSITATTGRKLDRFIIVVLAVAVTYLLIDKLYLQGLVQQAQEKPMVTSVPAVTDQNPSVAVLPFVNMSGDQENEYFSDGLTETLLHMLSQLPGLHVAARTSAFAFKGKNADIGEIASALGVAHVLEGSVQKANDRVRVTAQLIRANDGFHVWSQNYTRPLEDIFAIQDEIATDVADALGSSLLGGTKPDLHGVHTANLTAYESYLKGLEQQALFSYGSLDAAENHFKQALARDPEFTDARLSLIRNYLLKFTTGLTRQEDIRELVEPLIASVLERNPDEPLARAFELMLDMMMFDPSQNAEEIRAQLNELQDILAKLPTETFIRMTVAQTLNGYFQDRERAVEVLQAGLLADPLEPELNRTLGQVYMAEDRLDEARAALERSLELAPGNPNGYSTLARLEKSADNLPASMDWMRQAIQVDPQDHELAAQLARDFYNLRLPEVGDYWLARVQALAPGSGIARSLEVERSRAREETELAIELAVAAIEDQIEDRQSAFGSVVFNYADLMLEQGRAREAYEQLVSVRPGIVEYGQIPQELQGFIMQWASIVLMSGFESFENRKNAWLEFTAKLDEMGFPWRKDPADSNHTWHALMTGDLEAAIEHYLEYELNEPLAQNLNRHRKRVQAIYAPVYEDPRVAAKLIEDAERYAAVRNEVRAMLQQPEWSEL